jgi:drug/metabolite transporter (DMT)-like permease
MSANDKPTVVEPPIVKTSGLPALNVSALDSRTMIAAGVTIVIWASAFPAIRAGLHAFTPVHVALLRFMVASAVLAVAAIATRMGLPRWRDVPGIALMGLTGITAYNILLNTGEVTVPAAVASFIIASAPVFVALLATAFLGERLRGWGWIGIALSFGGVAIIALGGQSGFQIDANALIVAAAAVAQSLYFVGQKPYLKRYSPFRFSAYAIWCGTLFLLVFLPGLLQEIQAAPLSATLAVVYMGVFPAALGFVTWAYVLSRIPASRAASFLYLVPAFALIIAWLWLGEVPGILALVGGALVLAGVILVNTRGSVRQR